MSETRQRTHQINVRLTPDEHAAVIAEADRLNTTPGDLIRRCLAVDVPAERSRIAAKIRENAANYYTAMQNEGFEVAARIAEGWTLPGVEGPILRTAMPEGGSRG